MVWRKEAVAAGQPEYTAIHGIQAAYHMWYSGSILHESDMIQRRRAEKKRRSSMGMVPAPPKLASDDGEVNKGQRHRIQNHFVLVTTERGKAKS